MQDYLKKSVSNQRTGANIVGITLDNLNLMNFSDDFKTTFNIIEEFAKRTDEINLKHEKDAFRVELRKKQLEFSGKYSDHDIYTNNEKYNAMMKDYNNLKLEAEKEIANFKWATPQEKKILLEDYKNNFNEEYLKMYSKRQNAVLLKTVDKTQFLIESTKNNLKLMDLSNVGERNKEINKLSEYYDDLVGFNCMTEYEKAINLSSDIVEIEKDGIRKQLEENILFGTQYPTIEEKQKAIDDIKNSLLNEDRLNSTVENVIKTYKLDDQENVRIYMKTKLKNEYNNISNDLIKKINYLSKKEGRERKIYETDIVDAINLGDPEKLASLTLNDKFGTTDFLGNRDDILEILTNSDINNFYDIDSSDFFPVLTNGYFSKISKDKAELERNGYRGRQALQPLYDMVGNLSGGDNDKKAMIYKHYGHKTGLNPYALFKGEKDPDYIEATEGLRAGKTYIANNRYSIDSEVIGSKALGKLDTIALNFSKDNIVIGRDRATKFVLGVLYNNDLTKKKIEADTDIALKEALNNTETYNRLFELSKKAGEFEGKKIYRQVNLKDPRLLYLKPKKKEEGQTEQQKKENEEKEKKIVENSKGW